MCSFVGSVCGHWKASRGRRRSNRFAEMISHDSDSLHADDDGVLRFPNDAGKAMDIIGAISSNGV
jgi:hypothetical protein